MNALGLDRRATWRAAAIVVAGVALATLAVAFLERVVGVPDASSVYLVAVVISGMAAGTVAAVTTAIASIVTYDLLFTEPFLALVITDTSEWLSLVLLSFVGVTVGQIVSLQHRRTRDVLTREREARDLYAVSRALATRTSTADVLSDIAHALRERAGLARVWFALGSEESAERTVADTDDGAPPSVGGSFSLLKRSRGEPPREWVVIHSPSSHGARPDAGVMRHRVLIEAGGVKIGSLWGIRDRSAGPLDAISSRLLATAADQVGQAIRQDRLAAEAADAEVARQGSALKSALLEAVSHDLRTPLASIRAAAGTLMDPEVRLEAADVILAAWSIDHESERLDRMVTNLLDLGRIEGGALRTASEAVELGELVRRALSRLQREHAAGPDGRHVDVQVEESWVDGDPVLLEQALLNVLENAFRHTPDDALVRVEAVADEDDRFIRLSIEDSGPGVPEEALPRLFEKFYRVRSPGSSKRPGSGLGLAIVEGFVEAMGGRVSARRSTLGGLAVDLDLVRTHIPAELLVTR